jgi:cobaltochelatase CobS
MEPIRQPVKKKPLPANELSGTENEQPALAPSKLPTYPDRPKRQFSVRETFRVDLGPERNEKGEAVKDKQGKEVLRDRRVEGYVSPTEHTPTIDPNYVFPRDATLAILMGIALKDSILLVGNTGSGKTSLVEQIGARLNYSVVKISFDCAVNRNDLIGEWIIKGKEMQFQYGIIPIAFRMPGTIILLDEWDAQNAETSYVLQRPLQKEDRKIFLLETLELIGMHPDNVLCASANTNGQGDDTGLYGHGTRIQSYAQLNRFTVTVRLDYLPPEQEKEILSRVFAKDGLDKDEIDSLVLAVNKVRDGFTNGQLSVPLSTRDLINWTQKYIAFGDALKAATFCFLNRMSIEDAKVCENLIQRSFESE